MQKYQIWVEVQCTHAVNKVGRKKHSITRERERKACVLLMAGHMALAQCLLSYVQGWHIYWISALTLLELLWLHRDYPTDLDLEMGSQRPALPQTHTWSVCWPQLVKPSSGPSIRFGEGLQQETVLSSQLPVSSFKVALTVFPNGLSSASP